MICRLCLVESTSEVLNIFDDKGVQLQIADIISKHFWFRPSKEDSVSDKVCCSCWTTVASFHEFYCCIENAQKQLVNILQSSSYSSELLPVALDDLKREQVYSEKFDEDTSNDCLSRNIMSSDNVEAVIENNDPLTEENVKVESESNDIIIKSEMPAHTELNDRNVRRITRTKSSKNKPSVLSQPKKKNRITNQQSSDESCNAEGEIDSESDDATTKIKSTKRGPYRKSSSKQHDNIQKACRKQKTDIEKSAQRKKIEEEDEKIAKFVRMECDICFGNFTCFSELKIHIKEKHEKPLGYVVCCNKKIFKRGLLLDHINYHMNPEAFPCTLCDKKFSNSRNLRYHVTNQHNTDKSKLLSCDQCQKTFVKNSSLKRHKLTHALPEERHFQCDLCEKAYPSKSHLNYHIRDVHERAYDLVCDICAKRIKGKALMDKHRLEHAGVKEPKVQCQKCGSWQKNERNLKKHMRLHEEALLGLKCDICGRQATTKGALREHVRFMHEKQRIFKCTFCEKAFKNEGSLKEHITTHTGGALYTCSFCPQTFNSNANMYSHRKKVHPKEWEELNRQRINPVCSTTLT